MSKRLSKNAIALRWVLQSLWDGELDEEDVKTFSATLDSQDEVELLFQQACRDYMILKSVWGRRDGGW